MPGVTIAPTLTPPETDTAGKRGNYTGLAQLGFLEGNVGIDRCDLGLGRFIVLPADTPDLQQLFLTLQHFLLQRPLCAQFLYLRPDIGIVQLYQGLAFLDEGSLPELYGGDPSGNLRQDVHFLVGPQGATGTDIVLEDLGADDISFRPQPFRFTVTFNGIFFAAFAC